MAGLIACLAATIAACTGGDPGQAATAGVSDDTPDPVVVSERTLVAQDIALTPEAVRVPTGLPIRITFDNHDAGVPHGLALYADAAHTIELAQAAIIVGLDQAILEIPSLVPGRYHFSCVIHPNMDATLTVDPG